MEITKKSRIENISNEHPKSDPNDEYIILPSSVFKSWVDGLSFEDLLCDYHYNTGTNKNPLFEHKEVKKYALERLRNMSCSGYENGGTALHEFVKKRNLTCIRFLLSSNDIDKNAFDTKMKTALNYAFEAPIDIGIIKTLINKGCDINIAFTDSNKLFTVDVLRNIECVMYLVDVVKFDLDKYELTDQTNHPILTAFRNDIIEAFDFLVAKMPGMGRDHQFKWKGNHFTTLGTICAQEPRNQWFVESIMKMYPKNLFTIPVEYFIEKNEKVKSAHVYDFAIYSKNAMFVETLLKRGDDLDHFNSIGFHPLHTAVKYNNLEIVRLIRKYKLNLPKFNVDVMTKKEPKVTSLYIAVCNGNFEMCEELLGMGANPNARIRNTSILHVEVLKNRVSPNLLELLLKHGANPNYRDRNSRLPSDYAYCFENNNVKTIIKSLFNKPKNFGNQTLPTIGENGKMIFGEIINISETEKN